MINTLADLLIEISEKENQRLKELNITHPPTIGAMYEGLTADILTKSLFGGLNLVVAKSSFIKSCHTEFDVILAEGNGRCVPYTDKQEFTPEQVLAIIQVKKTFNAKELGDSYKNLMRIPDIYVGMRPKDYMMEIATDSVHNTLQRSIKDYDLGKLTLEEEYVYHTLVTDAQLPVTIVLGYNGLKSEKSLRDKYYEYLNGKISTNDNLKKGYGPCNFPTLLICGEYSIVKMTGSPFNAPLKQSAKGWWDFMASSHYNPMYFFLEVLWSKLSYRYELPPIIFGEDLDTPKMTPFLSCQITKHENMIGWNYWYHEFDNNSLKSVNGTDEWQPIILDEIQFRVMNVLCLNEVLDFSDVPQIEKDALDFGYESLDFLIQSLCKTGYVTRLDNNRICLITKGCQVMMIGDKYLMGENNSGRFDNWLMKHTNELLPWTAKKHNQQ